MRKISKDKYSKMQVDALREIGSIGAGHAATALSALLKKKILINVPNVSIVRIEDVPKAVCDEEGLVRGVYFEMKGDISGSTLILFPSKSAYLLVDLVTGKIAGSTKDMHEKFDDSVFMEICNILMGAYLTALGDMTGIILQHSVPYLASDYAGAIINSVLAEIGQTSDIALLIETEFVGTKENVIGKFFMLPEKKSSMKILDTLGVKE